MARSLAEVIDRLVEIAPELEVGLSRIRESSLYMAPEAQGHLWRAAGQYLDECAGVDHPKFAELVRAFAGPPKEATK